MRKKLALVLVVLAVVALSATAGLGRYQSLKVPTAKATILGGDGTGGGEGCTLQNDFFNDFSTTGQIGMQLHIKCSNANALIKGTIGCIQMWWDYDNAWHLAECWSGQGYGVLVLGGFVDCYKSLGTYVYRGEGTFNVTFPDGAQFTYPAVTGERAIQCIPGGQAPPIPKP